MTHADDYISDQQAIFLFDNAFSFITSWTNLQFHALPPLEIVEKYFELRPNEREPIWTVS